MKWLNAKSDWALKTYKCKRKWVMFISFFNKRIFCSISPLIICSYTTWTVRTIWMHNAISFSAGFLTLFYAMWNISGLIFLLFAYFFLFRGTRYIPWPLQAEPWRDTFPTKSFPRVLLWVHHTSLLMKNPLYTLHIHCFLSIQIFTIRFLFRSAHMFKNSGCFGQFHYLSNALKLHCCKW